MYLTVAALVGHCVGRRAGRNSWVYIPGGQYFGSETSFGRISDCLEHDATSPSPRATYNIATVSQPLVPEY